MQLISLLISLILMLRTALFAQYQNIFIQTQSAGNITGTNQNINGKGYGVFLGIPYAKPPIGNLRFREPQPLDAKNTATVIDASHGFSKMCVQPVYSANNQSEDCLYLNVLTPKIHSSDGTKYPVMMWIHGGGFIGSSASDYPVEGTIKNIVSRGVVYVSINYRLGTFGFLTTKSSAAPGNYGLFDQLEALRWIQKNIQFFGGDPAKVTVFGESAGGVSGSLLTISPLANGLFSQAIMISGSALSPWALMYDADPYDTSEIALESLGCRQKSVKLTKPLCPYRTGVSNAVSADLLKQHEIEMDCLRSKSVAEIATQISAFHAKPRIDGKFLSEAPAQLIKKRNPQNLIIGVSGSEMATFMFDPFPEFGGGTIPQTVDEFYRSAQLFNCKSFKYPALVNFTANYYYANSSTPTSSGLDEKHFWFQQSVKRDSGFMFTTPAYLDALEATNINSKVYLYSWDWQNAIEFFDPKTDFYWKGATHGSELFSLFDSDGSNGVFRDVLPSRRDKSQDNKSKEVFGKLFTNFAKFGNPTPDNSVDGVTWQPFTKEGSNYLSIDMPKIRMANKFYEHDVGLWTGFIPMLEGSVKCG